MEIPSFIRPILGRISGPCTQLHKSGRHTRHGATFWPLGEGDWSELSDMGPMAMAELCKITRGCDIKYWLRKIPCTLWLFNIAMENPHF